MRVAFDLDDTLISASFAVEPPKKRLISKLIKHQKLRKGTAEIFKFCKDSGWETWIYTTSYRTVAQIKRNFWLYNISLDGVVNQRMHKNAVSVCCSKYPPQFGIDVIVDDSEGVASEAEKYRFEAIVVSPSNSSWVSELKELLHKAHRLVSMQ